MQVNELKKGNALLDMMRDLSQFHKALRGNGFVLKIRNGNDIRFSLDLRKDEKLKMAIMELLEKHREGLKTELENL